MLSPSPTQIHNPTLEIGVRFLQQRDVCIALPFRNVDAHIGSGEYRQHTRQSSAFSIFDGPSGFKMMTGCCTSSRKEDPLRLSPLRLSLYYRPCSCTSIVSLQLGPRLSVYRKPIRNSPHWKSSHKGEVNRGEPNVRFFLSELHKPFVCTDGRNIVIPGDLLALRAKAHNQVQPPSKPKNLEK